MGVLGKDLLDFHRPRTNTKVEFGASGYWVESHPTMQPYGAVLTEILNLDAAPFQELLDQYRKTVAEKDAEQAARAFQAVTNGFASLPLYRLYWNDVQLFASMDVRELFVGEAQEAFREYVMQDDTLPRFMQEQLDAIRLIQERYASRLKRKRVREKLLWPSRLRKKAWSRSSAASALAQIRRWTRRR